MSKTNKSISILSSPFRMHSVSSIRTPANISNFGGMQPRVVLNRLKLSSAKSFYMPSVSVTKCFHQGPRIRLSPLKSSLIRRHNLQNEVPLGSRRNVYLGLRRKVYPKINKCNTKSCVCCKHISCKPTIRSSVNGRQYSVNIDTDID